MDKVKDIYILGNGGFAKEVFFLITEINKVNQEYHFKGFVDVMPEQNHAEIGNNSYPIFEENAFIEENKDNRICLAIGFGSPKIIQKVTSKYSNKFEFPNLIHPNLIVYKDSLEIGVGNIITSNCIFTINIKVGSFNVFNLNITVGHDVVIGSFNVINPSVNLSGKVEIGDGNLIGVNATILQNLTIGNYSIIGASSLLSKNLESNKLALGVPAKVVKELE